MITGLQYEIILITSDIDENKTSKLITFSYNNNFTNNSVNEIFFKINLIVINSL